MMNVSVSEIGNETRSPFNPQNVGSKIANPTPNISSRVREISVDSTAFPNA